MRALRFMEESNGIGPHLWNSLEAATKTNAESNRQKQSKRPILHVVMQKAERLGGDEDYLLRHQTVPHDIRVVTVEKRQIQPKYLRMKYRKRTRVDLRRR
jgi:hypothetical protein